MNTDRLRDAHDAITKAKHEIGGRFSDLLKSLEEHAGTVREAIEAIFEVPESEPEPKPTKKKETKKK